MIERPKDHPVCDLTFLTCDHPEAEGREPVADEQEICLPFNLEFGRTVEIRMGLKYFYATLEMMVQLEEEIIQEEGGNDH